MSTAEYNKVKSQVLVLAELLPIYGGKTLENIQTMLEARLSEYDKTRKEK